jgi:DNA modification methylase
MKLRDRIKELRRVKASEILPNPANWRTHPKAQQDAMRGILAEVGIADALLVRETPAGLQLIDGHLRADVAPDSEWPVLVLDVDDKEAAKLLATVDPLAAMAETDPEKLQELLRQIDVDSEALQQMLAELADEAGLQDDGAEIVEDEVPAPPDEATTQLGDLWILGNHRLLCGDSSKPEYLDRLLDGAEIHLVNTDPPYNVKVEPRSNNAIAAGLSSFAGPKHHQSLDLARHPEKSKPTGKKLRAKDRPLANDFVSDEAFDELLAAWFGNIARVLEPGRAFYIWGGYANCANYPPVLKACELYFSQAVIWVKEHPVLTRKDFMGNHEWCFYGWREGAAHQWLGPTNAVDVWTVKKVNPQSMVHLTEKPVELAARAMRYSSRQSENVLDLFGGSGSTLMAAEQTGRHAYLMELDPPYCDVIVERWEKFTGQKAQRQSGFVHSSSGGAG